MQRWHARFSHHSKTFSAHDSGGVPRSPKARHINDNIIIKLAGHIQHSGHSLRIDLLIALEAIRRGEQVNAALMGADKRGHIGAVNLLRAAGEILQR